MTDLEGNDKVDLLTHSFDVLSPKLPREADFRTL